MVAGVLATLSIATFCAGLWLHDWKSIAAGLVLALVVLIEPFDN